MTEESQGADAPENQPPIDITERLRILRELADAQAASENAAGAQRRAVMEDFVYDTRENKFWDIVLCEPREPIAVNKCIPLSDWPISNDQNEQRIKPTAVIGQSGGNHPASNQRVDETTWCPGRPRIIENERMARTGFMPQSGHRSLNRYRQPDNSDGHPALAMKWVNHVKRLWPNQEEHEYFFKFCAHMIQRPEDKCNAGICLSGGQGIGKDLTLLPLKYAAGRDNCADIHPDDLFTRFQEWVACVMLIINEVRPAQDEHKASSMYQILKDLIIGTDALTLEMKFMHKQFVPNCLRVFLTTNDPLALYIPPDDRRIFMMHTNIQRTWETPEYFTDLATYIHESRGRHVAAWLRELDLSCFNAKAEPPKTAQWKSIAESWKSPEDSVSYALDKLGYPDVLFAQELAQVEGFDQPDALQAIARAHRKLPHRMHDSGYTLVPSATLNERWEFKDKPSGVSFKSRAAYAKHVIAENINNARALLEDRGREIVSYRAATNSKNVVPIDRKGLF